MKHNGFFRKATAAAGALCLIGAAGTDQRFTEMGQMPPESIETVIIIGLILLVPMALHILRKELQRGIHNGLYR